MNAIKTVGFRSDDAKTVGLTVGLGEYGNEQSFQYQKEGLDLEFFDTQSNNVDYLWKCCIEHGMRHVMEYCHNNVIRFIPTSQKKAVTLHPNNYQFHSQLFEHL